MGDTACPCLPYFLKDDIIKIGISRGGMDERISFLETINYGGRRKEKAVIYSDL